MKIGTSNIHNAIKFTVSIAYDAYVMMHLLWVTSFSSGPLRFCQQKHSSSCNYINVYYVCSIEL